MADVAEPAADAAGPTPEELGAAWRSRETAATVDLHRAVLLRDLELAERTLAAGADVNSVGPLCEARPLHLACNENMLHPRELELAYGLPPDALLGDEQRAIGAEIAARLVEAGADVRAADDERWTPLHYAAEARCRDTCRLLLDRGADAAAENSIGERPYRTADEIAPIDGDGRPGEMIRARNVQVEFAEWYWAYAAEVRARVGRYTKPARS